MLNTDLKNVSDLLAGKTAVQVEVPVKTILFLSLGIFVAVLLSVIIANEITKTK